MKHTLFEEHLYKGHYEELCSASVDNPNYVLKGPDLPWIIGGLGFIGRYEESEALFKLKDKFKLNELQIACCRFFLGISNCRQGELKISRKYFVQNYFLTLKNKEPLLLFYVYQGIAFYRYSTGYFEQAHYWSKKALEAALGSFNLYASILAYELLGHVLLQLGFVNEGFKKLNIANIKSEALGEGVIKSVTTSVINLYSSTFGTVGAPELKNRLNVSISNCLHDESYMKASLNIELAKVTFLSGDLYEAKKILDIVSPLVYEIKNPYLEIKYNFSLANILYHKGDYQTAQALLNSCLEQSSTHLDLLIKNQGLLYKISSCRPERVIS